MNQLSLSQVLDIEHEKVTGGGQACGADHHGSTEPAELCQRVKGHEEAGEAAREAHAHLVYDTDEKGQTAARYWLTWQNVTPQGRPTSELTKPDGS